MKLGLHSNDLMLGMAFVVCFVAVGVLIVFFVAVGVLIVFFVVVGVLVVVVADVVGPKIALGAVVARMETIRFP